MWDRRGHSRTLVALLLAVAVPFCCCNVRSLLGACRPGSAGSALARAVAAHDGSGPPASGAAHGCCDGPRSDDGGPDGSLPERAPGDERHDCPCEKYTGKVLTAERPSIELPVQAVVAVLTWAVAPGPSGFDSRCALAVEQRAVDRARSSLLRMHCALIV